MNSSLLLDCLDSRPWLENLELRVLGQITHFILGECWNYEGIGAFCGVGRSMGLLNEQFGGVFLNRRAASSRELHSNMTKLASRFST